MTHSADSPPLALPAHVAVLLDTVQRWPTARWREALCTAREPLHRARRNTSRALCDALLSHEERNWHQWLVRDAVRTAISLAAPALARHGNGLAIELVEDAALAVLARPALPLLDLAVLLGPCLPLRD
ncbi:MAG: hypothetical protein ABMA00_08400 [Gemmatimonas sp.]